MNLRPRRKPLSEHPDVFGSYTATPPDGPCIRIQPPEGFVREAAGRDLIGELPVGHDETPGVRIRSNEPVPASCNLMERRRRILDERVHHGNYRDSPERHVLQSFGEGVL